MKKTRFSKGFEEKGWKTFRFHIISKNVQLLLCSSNFPTFWRVLAQARVQAKPRSGPRPSRELESSTNTMKVNNSPTFLETLQFSNWFDQKGWKNDGSYVFSSKTMF